MADNVVTDNKVLEEVINNSWSGIGIIDSHTRFVYVNAAFTPILGFSESELKQIKFEGLLLPKYKEQFKALIEKNYQNQYTNHIQVECRRKDKEIVYLDISIKIMSDKKHIVINANDITQSISDHETFDRYVIQAHIDTKGIITDVSEAFCRLCLYSSEELVGKSYDVLYYPELNEEDLNITVWSDIMIDQQYNGIIASKTKHGDTFWVDIIIKPIKNKYGDVTGYSAVMFDITNEVNLQKNTEALEETIGENEAKLKIMGETLRTVAHEWRQPLNSISLEAQNLLFSYQFSDEAVPKDEAIPILESMKDQIEGLSNVINKFQLITEIQGDKQEAHIDDVSNRAISMSKIKSEVLKKKYDADNSVFLTHENELVTSIASILDNAYEAIENCGLDGSRFVFYKTKLSEDKTKILIEIANNGGNIPVDIKDKIFDAYFSTKKTRNGVGLSLYIAKMIIELHLKGRIEVVNKAKDIVVFNITLPIEEL